MFEVNNMIAEVCGAYQLEKSVAKRIIMPKNFLKYIQKWFGA